MSEKTNFTSYLSPNLMQFTISAIFSVSNAFYTVQTDIQSNRDVTNSYILHFSKSTVLYFIFSSRGVNRFWWDMLNKSTKLTKIYV